MNSCRQFRSSGVAPKGNRGDCFAESPPRMFTRIGNLTWVENALGRPPRQSRLGRDAQSPFAKTPPGSSPFAPIFFTNSRGRPGWPGQSKTSADRLRDPATLPTRRAVGMRAAKPQEPPQYQWLTLACSNVSGNPLESKDGGRCRIRTYDFHRVKVTLYR